MATSAVAPTRTVKRLRITIAACTVGEDQWLQLSEGTWLQKTGKTYEPTFNPEHLHLEVYQVMDGNYQGKRVYRTGASIENFLQVEE